MWTDEDRMRAERQAATSQAHVLTTLNGMPRADLHAALVALFDGLSERERTDALGALAERFCPHCGGDQPKWCGGCQCENDE